MTEPSLVEALIKQVRSVIYVQDDVVIAEGQRNTDGMFFVTDGELDVLVSVGGGQTTAAAAAAAAADQIAVAMLAAGDVFGEISLIDPTSKAKATVRVRSFCEGFVLSAEAFHVICFDFPSFRIAVYRMAEEREQKNARSKTRRQRDSGGHQLPQRLQARGASCASSGGGGGGGGGGSSKSACGAGCGAAPADGDSSFIRKYSGLNGKNLRSLAVSRARRDSARVDGGAGVHGNALCTNTSGSTLQVPAVSVDASVHGRRLDYSRTDDADTKNAPVRV